MEADHSRSRKKAQEEAGEDSEYEQEEKPKIRHEGEV